MFALYPRSKVLVKLFQKLAGLGRAHKNGVSFCQAFFFAPFVSKKKRIRELVGVKDFCYLFEKR